MVLTGVRAYLSNTSIAVAPWPFGVAAAILLILLVVGTPLDLSGVSDPFETVGLLVAGFAVGIALIWKGLNDLMLLRFIRDTPTSDIGSMASGDVEVKGTVQRLEQDFQAPFSQKRCVAYQYKIEEYKQRGKNSRWETVDFGGTEELFAVKDDTGAAAVDPSGADLEVEWHQVARTDGGEDPPQKVQEFIGSSSEVGFENDGLFGGNRRRYKQKVVEPGDRLYVFGEASTYAASGVKEIREGKAPVYIISDKTESELADDLSKWHRIVLPLGLLIALVCYAILYVYLL